MKRYLSLFLFFMALGLYAQSTDFADEIREQANEFDQAPEIVSAEQPKAEETKNEGDQPSETAQTVPAKPPKRPASFSRRYFEFGFDAGVGVANNLIGAGDILQKEIVIDLNKLVSKIGDDGLKLNVDVAADVFLNFMPGGLWGFGLSANVSGGIYGNIPKSMLTLIGEGNKNTHSPNGDITAFGGVFADAEVNFHTNLKKFVNGRNLKISVTPAVYVPIIYIPKSSIKYRLDADSELAFAASGEINAYSPFDLENFKMDESSIADAMGVDFSLNAEYELLKSFLDIGADITHIPLAPSTLNHQMNITIPVTEIKGSSLLDKGLELPEELIEQTYGKASYQVVRPLRFDFYTLIHPLKTNVLTLRPNIGFTALTPSEEPYFNAGLDVRLNLRDLFMFHIGIGYEELLWKHRAGLAFNLRVFELDIEAGLRSQDFLSSFQASGFNLMVGMRFGF